jgi:purine-binding chemotaxis protein CheW
VSTQTNQAATTEVGTVAHLAGKYLTFRLHGEEYGLEIMKVQEIIGMLPVSAVPRAPRYVRGIVNLRGRIIPTIDLRTKFGLPGAQDTPRTCIVVVQVAAPRGPLSLGLIVDEVAEVLDVTADCAAPVSEFAGNISMEYVLGAFVINDSVTLLLDIDRVMSFEELHTVQAQVATHDAN